MSASSTGLPDLPEKYECRILEDRQHARFGDVCNSLLINALVWIFCVLILLVLFFAVSLAAIAPRSSSLLIVVLSWAACAFAMIAYFVRVYVQPFDLLSRSYLWFCSAVLCVSFLGAIFSLLHEICEKPQITSAFLLAPLASNLLLVRDCYRYFKSVRAVRDAEAKIDMALSELFDRLTEPNEH